LRTMIISKGLRRLFRDGKLEEPARERRVSLFVTHLLVI
jgi:hypothetical protein